MKIYLGLPGSESLITGYSRKFIPKKRENYEDVVSEDDSITRYTTGAVKHFFNFSYGTIAKADFDVIEAEYDRHTILSLKIEKDTGSGTYNTYNVLFDGEITNPMDMDYPDRRDYEDVSFTLKET